MACIHRIIRIFAFISLLFAVGVILVNIWIFGSILYHENHHDETLTQAQFEGAKSKEDARTEPQAYFFKPWASSPSPPPVQINTFEIQELAANGTEKNTLVVDIVNAQNPERTSPPNKIAEEDTIPTTEPPQQYHHWAKLKKMSGTFKGIILGCTWMVILGGLIQFCSSVPLLFQLSKRMSSVAGYTVGIHFISFTILLICFLAPLTYNRDYVENEVEDQLQQEETHLSWEQFVELTKAKWRNMETNPIHFIMDDLNLYYASIGVDIIVIVINMFVFSSVLNCSSNKHIDGKDYNSLH